jgi:predicted deacylase
MHPNFFSPDFRSAQRRFRSAALALGARIHVLPLGINAPDGDQLSIDIAWLGPLQPKRALIHVCGIHGVEGFAGSAVQLALLDQPPALPADCALILVHVLNPYGMAYLRRVNEHNIDLNRNFFIGSTGWHGASDGYARIDRFLNPPCPPARVDSYYGRLLLAWAGMGKDIINQAVASGQYRFPKGIFYGGTQLESGPQAYCDWLAGHLREVQEVFVIDVHCGIGAYGQQHLFLSTPAVNAADLSRALQVPVANRDQASNIMGYTHEGCHSGIYRQLLPAARAVCITQEFGTYNGIRLLHALRAENQHHHYGDGRLEHWSKRELKRKFCPEDAAWCSRVVSNGCDLVRRALMLFDGTGSVALS